MSVLINLLIFILFFTSVFTPNCENLTLPNLRAFISVDVPISRIHMLPCDLRELKLQLLGKTKKCLSAHRTLLLVCVLQRKPHGKSMTKHSQMVVEVFFFPSVFIK